MINISYINNKMKINIEGRIDSSNADETEKEIFNHEYDGKDVIIDADKLDYISSAGLRVIMKIKKKCAALQVLNVSRDVYDIFDMTGFTNIIDVRRAMREIDLGSCEEIGGTNNFDGTALYRIDEDTVLKLHPKGTSLEELEKRNARSKEAFTVGLPIAISYDVVKAGDRFGYIYGIKKISTLAGEMQKNQDALKSYAEKAADLLKEIHSTEIHSKTSDIKTVFRSYLKNMDEYIKPDEERALNELIDAAPDGNKTLHCSFHTKNILVDRDELMIMDMADACKGNVLFDLASVWISICRISDENLFRFMGIMPQNRQLFLNTFISEYFDSTNTSFINEVLKKTELLSKIRFYLSPGIIGGISPKVRDHFINEMRSSFMPNSKKIIEDIKNIGNINLNLSNNSVNDMLLFQKKIGGVL